MKRLKITVNGTPYDVQVEEMNGAAPMPAAPVPTPVAAPAAPAPAPAPAAAPAGSGEGEKVGSPMPGTILDIKASVGDSVTNGQPVIVLEAMKMENDICAPKDGTITSISVNKGDSVESGTTLFTIA